MYMNFFPITTHLEGGAVIARAEADCEEARRSLHFGDERCVHPPRSAVRPPASLSGASEKRIPFFICLFLFSAEPMFHTLLMRPRPCGGRHEASHPREGDVSCNVPSEEKGMLRADERLRQTTTDDSCAIP